MYNKIVHCQVDKTSKKFQKDTINISKTLPYSLLPIKLTTYCICNFNVIRNRYNMCQFFAYI